MEQNQMLMLPVFFPIVMGIFVLTVKALRQNRKKLTAVVIGSLVLGAAFTFAALAVGGGFSLWKLTDAITVEFAVDGISVLFAALTSAMWVLVGIYSITYMSHEKEEYRFFGFYLIVYGVLNGLDFSANLITMYLFYEMMTLTSLPLVLHEMTKEAVAAGLKYLFYSIAL